MADGARPGPSRVRQARDVMAFGQELGRVLSDGRIVGRAEPFAKVFPSSRVVKRAVGLGAWGVLEDIALDARLDDQGRLVSETSVRRIAANLGLNKDTVTNHLARLRDHGFVLHEERRDGASGRYEQSRYVLDPSACVERFTTSPPPCPTNPDTVPASENTGHGRTGHREPGRKEQEAAAAVGEQQQHAAEPLTDVGVTPEVARRLAAVHSPERIHAALASAGARAQRNPAGWVVRALDAGWPLPELSSQVAERRRVAQESAHEAEAAQAQARQERCQRWCAAISAALDDAGLIQAVQRITTPAAGLNRRSVPLARAQLVAWAVQASQQHPERALSTALGTELDHAVAEPVAPLAEPPSDEPLPEPPPAAAGPDLTTRIRAALTVLDQEEHRHAS